MKKLNKVVRLSAIAAMGLIPFVAGYVTGVTDPKTATAIKEAFTPRVVEVEKIVEVEKVVDKELADTITFLLEAKNLHLHVHNEDARYRRMHRMTLDYQAPGSALKTEMLIEDTSKYKSPRQALAKLVQDAQRLQQKYEQEASTQSSDD